MYLEILLLSLCVMGTLGQHSGEYNVNCGNGLLCLTPILFAVYNYVVHPILNV